MANAAEMPTLRADMTGPSAVVHPLVLLNCVDHYNRVARDTSKRVVGVLLGQRFNDQVDVTNSFAVPFEEDRKNPDVWYLDHNYLEEMEHMFRKVNAREKVVGFYSTGPKIRPNDLQIDALFHKYTDAPVFVIIDVRPHFEGVPVKAYVAKEELKEDGKETCLEFKHLPSIIGATESEEVCVEHLLRDINDPTVSTLASKVKQKITALKGLKTSLEEMQTYLQKVVAGEMTPNNQIIYNIQSIFNLLPNINVEELAKAFLVKSNDIHLVIYISSLVRSITALHDLVQNKIRFNASSDGNATKTQEAGSETKESDTSAKKGKDADEKKP
jgi:26S proteasome regulatory subunit N8|eukprot:g4447.t1